MWKAKFFGSFWVLNTVSKQAYKLKFPKKWRIYNVFYELLLKQDTIRKKQVDENTTQLEFELNKNKKYKFKGI